MGTIGCVLRRNKKLKIVHEGKVAYYATYYDWNHRKNLLIKIIIIQWNLVYHTVIIRIMKNIFKGLIWSN